MLCGIEQRPYPRVQDGRREKEDGRLPDGGELGEASRSALHIVRLVVITVYSTIAHL